MIRAIRIVLAGIIAIAAVLLCLYHVIGYQDVGAGIASLVGLAFIAGFVAVAD